MGRRHRQRTKLAAPVAAYHDVDGNELRLRGSLTPATRGEYAGVFHGGLDREDARQRAMEMLFERLAVSWTISGLATTRQKQLVGRYRVASAGERAFVLESLRSHLAEHFPEMESP